MNKHLINAVRYLDAVHDIQIDEEHPKLAKLLEKHVQRLGSKTLDNYWRLYLIDIGASSEEEAEDIADDSDEYEEKTVFYRGAKKTVKVKKETSKPGLTYRGRKL